MKKEFQAIHYQILVLRQFPAEGEAYAVSSLEKGAVFAVAHPDGVGSASIKRGTDLRQIFCFGVSVSIKFLIVSGDGGAAPVKEDNKTALPGKQQARQYSNWRAWLNGFKSDGSNVNDLLY